MAAQRITGRELADLAGFGSHNYVAKRLRDDLPFTMDDIERLSAFWSEDAHQLIAAAYENHYERVYFEAEAAMRSDAEGRAARNGTPLVTLDELARYVASAVKVRRDVKVPGTFTQVDFVFTQPRGENVLVVVDFDGNQDDALKRMQEAEKLVRLDHKFGLVLLAEGRTDAEIAERLLSAATDDLRAVASGGEATDEQATEADRRGAAARDRQEAAMAEMDRKKRSRRGRS